MTDTDDAVMQQQRARLLGNARDAGVPHAVRAELARVMDVCEGWGARYADVSRDEIPKGSLVAFRLGTYRPSEMQQQHAADADTLIELIRAADEERVSHWREVAQSLSGRTGSHA